MTSPLNFIDNFLKQPYPSMGLAPSAAITKTGGTIIQEGSGRDGLGKTSDSQWGRISAGIPFGWIGSSLLGAANVTADVGRVVKTKTEEGAQAVDGKVKSLIEPAKQFLASTGNTLKWTLVAVIIVGALFFFAQVKALVRT